MWVHSCVHLMVRNDDDEARRSDTGPGVQQSGRCAQAAAVTNATCASFCSAHATKRDV